MPVRERQIEARGVRTILQRAEAVCRLADLRPTDHVLDVGCADGHVSLEVAQFVEQVHGLDLSVERILRARRSAAMRGIRNATFETATIQEYPLEPRSWDVCLFMRVWGKGPGTKTVAASDFARILRAARRQLIVQAGVKRWHQRLPEIVELCDENGFDALCFEQPHLIVANRRGAGAHIRELPTLALVPTDTIREHPVVRSFESADDC